MNNVLATSRPSRRMAVVTGGTRGIGRAVATRLIADGHDCLVVATADSAPAGLPAGAQYYGTDLRSRKAAQQLAEHLRGIQPTILVNNVGLNIKGATKGFPVDQYDLLLDTNLRVPFILIQAVLPAMLSEGWGRIVNVTSLWGVSGNSEDAAYCASKFGLDGLTASVAAEVARAGILVNSVAPGFIYTEQAAEAYTDEALKAVSEAIPVGRLGKPEEVAALVSWLVGPENTYVTGQNILIDGGLTRTAKP
jgi:NAD(P)-dependent dehydrogenase (short-subunit alcohol dehydrogenase family)